MTTPAPLQSPAELPYVNAVRGLPAMYVPLNWVSVFSRRRERNQMILIYGLCQRCETLLDGAIISPDCPNDVLRFCDDCR